MQWKPVFAWIPVETIVKEHQQEYYAAIAKSDSEANSTAFITFMLQCLKQALLEMKGSNQESNQEKVRKPALTKTQKDIVNFCSVPRSAQEILARLGLSNQSVNRKRHIQTLVDMGVLEMTIPDKRNDRNQKYRKREK